MSGCVLVGPFHAPSIPVRSVESLAVAGGGAMPDASPDLTRCAWVGDEPSMVRYHDEEWGVPCHDDRTLFEFLTLEGAQAGLSWRTILQRREGYRRAFLEWDIERIAAMTEADIDRLVEDEGIIRHRQKITSTIGNARIVLKLLPQWVTLDRYLWQFVDEVVVGRHDSMGDVPAVTERSWAMSKQMRRDGFTFVGPTTAYAFMQATGLVNDHTVDCFRFTEV
jgi:DNA-3-methyladenine glycosylase I